MKKILTALIIMCMAAGCACQHQPDASGAPDPVTLETAAKYMKEGEYAKAIESYSALISKDSGNAIYYLGRADAYAAIGTDEDLQSAEADYKKALELDDTMADAYIGLADVYIETDNYEAAAKTAAEGIIKITGVNKDGSLDDELETLNEKMAEISSLITGDETVNVETPEKQDAAGMDGSLSLSDMTYEFESGDNGGNEGAVGIMVLEFTVTGPENAALVRVAGFDEQLEDIPETAAHMASVWKNDESPKYGDTVPFQWGTGFPVYEDDFGKTLQVLLVGLDVNMDMVGYTVVEVPVSR